MFPWAGLVMGVIISSPGIFFFVCLICCTRSKSVLDKDNTISIVLPTYKRPAQLKRAVDSVLRQTYKDWRLYIVGDNCPFLTKLNLDQLDPRITVINLAQNHGAGGAVPRNTALISHVMTRWCSFLDDDNEWTFDHLHSLWQALQTNPNARFAFSSIVMDGLPITFDLPLRRGRIDTSCVLFEHALCKQYGYWKDRADAGYCHDWEFFSRWRHEFGVATRKPTLLYSCSAGGQNPQQIKQMYNDQ